MRRDGWRECVQRWREGGRWQPEESELQTRLKPPSVLIWAFNVSLSAPFFIYPSSFNRTQKVCKQPPYFCSLRVMKVHHLNPPYMRQLICEWASFFVHKTSEQIVLLINQWCKWWCSIKTSTLTVKNCKTNHKNITPVTPCETFLTVRTRTKR